MTELWPFIVSGLTAGAAYGLAATGLVLTYKTSGIFNFAHGAVAAAAAYLFYELSNQRGWPWPLAAAVTLLVFAPLLGVVLELVARRVSRTDAATRIVATVGILLIIQGVATARYGAAAIYFAPFLPHDSFALGNVRVSYDQVITVAVSVAAVVGLLVFFKRARLGLEMRAVVDDPELVDLNGSSPVAVRRAAWIIGSVFAALSGILLAPSIGLDATLLTLLVVQAFGAAAIGRFQSLNVTFIGGLAVGLGAALLTKWVAGHQQLAGLPSSLPFIVLFAVLALSKAGRFAAKEPRRRPYRPVTLDRWRLATLAVPVTAVVLLIPSLVGTKLPVYTNGAIYVTVFVSLALLVRTSGQVSLCHATFVAIGATTFSHLTHGAGLPWLVGLLLAGLVVVPVGALISLPAIRLSGLYLALATFGFAVLVERVVFSTGVMFGTSSALRLGSRPGVLGLDSDRGFFYLCALVAVIATLAAAGIRRTRLGRLLRGLADSPVALTTNGANANITRVLVFCASAFIAAVAGGLIVCLNGSANGAPFNALASLTYLAVLAVAGRSPVGAPVIAALAFVVAPSYFSDPNLASYLQIAFGSAAVLATCFGGSFGDWVTARGASTRHRRESTPVRARALTRAGTGA